MTDYPHKEKNIWEALILKRAEVLIKRKQEICLMKWAAQRPAQTSITHKQANLIAEAFEILKRKIES